MFQLDFCDHRPLYEQIKERMKELIISGALAENEKVPSVRELASKLAINPNTIQKAYKDLESDGYIYSLRAKGSFVAPQSLVVQNTKISELDERFESLIQEMYFCGVSYKKMIEKIDLIYKKED